MNNLNKMKKEFKEMERGGVSYKGEVAMGLMEGVGILKSADTLYLG